MHFSSWIGSFWKKRLILIFLYSPGLPDDIEIPIDSCDQINHDKIPRQRLQMFPTLEWKRLKL